MRPPTHIVIGLGALALAGSSGFLASRAIGAAVEPSRTVTVNVGTGQQGPAGPAGPEGPRGPAGPPGPAGLTCPAGYAPGKLVINHPGGHVSIWTCLED